MKQIHTWKEPWKRTEPGARLSDRQKVNDGKGVMERANMEEKARQKVKIICQDELLGVPGMFHRFEIRVKIPMRKKEIDERIKLAFPGFDFEEGS